MQTVRAAFAANETFLRSLRPATATDADDLPDPVTDRGAPELVAAEPDGGGVPAGTPAAAKPAARDDADSSGTGPRPSTDGEALLALARAALDQQRATQPDPARRSRARLVAQIDPLSGWGRLSDGELLPPTSLTTVLKILPGRSGVLRLRPLTAADLTRHDQGRRSRTPSQALHELLGALDGEAAASPAAPGTASTLTTSTTGPPAAAPT